MMKETEIETVDSNADASTIMSPPCRNLIQFLNI